MAKSPQIAVQIAAVDQFSATLKKFRAQLAATNGPVGALNAKLSGLQVPTLNPRSLVAGAMQAHNSFAARVGGSLKTGIPGLSLFGSMAGSIPGMGALGGIGAAAGIGSLVERFAGAGVALRNTAQMAGTSTAGMDSMRGAFRMMGQSAEAADSMMTGLNRTIGNAYFGKDNGAASAFRQIGISMLGMNGQALKAEQLVPRISDSIKSLAKVDPRAALTVLDGLHLSPETLSVLGLGADKLAALRAEAARLSGVTDESTASSERFTAAQGRVGIAVDRLGRSILVGLEPALTPLLTDLATFASQHAPDVQRGFTNIATAAMQADWKGIGQGVKDVGGAFLYVTEKVKSLHDEMAWINDKGSSIADFLDRITGLKGYKDRQSSSTMTAASSTAFNMVQPPLPSGSAAAPSTEVQKARTKEAMDFFIGKGRTPEQAAGIVANLYSESKLNPGEVGDSGLAYGIAQWHPDRRAALAAAGKQVVNASFHDQLEAVDTELRGREVAAGRSLDATKTAYDAGSSVSQEFERPRDRLGEAARRGALAERMLRQYRAAPAVEPAPEQPDLTRGGRLPALLPPPAPPATAQGQGNTNSQSTVHVHLTGDGMPPGMGVQTKVAGDGAELSTVRLRYAMPAGG